MHPIIEIDALDLKDVCPIEKAPVDFRELLMAHPNLVGATCKNPLKSVTSGYETETYIYEFDNEGYPTKIIKEGEFDSTTYTLIWQ